MGSAVRDGDGSNPFGSAKNTCWPQATQVFFCIIEWILHSVEWHMGINLLIYRQQEERDMVSAEYTGKKILISNHEGHYSTVGFIDRQLCVHVS